MMILLFSGLFLVGGMSFCILRKSRVVSRRIAWEWSVAALAMIALSFLSPHLEYPVGHDVVHALGNGRFQIWQTEDVVYSFSDEAKATEEDGYVGNVVKWCEGSDACYLVTIDRRYVVVDKKNGAREFFADYDSIPPRYIDPFRKMRFWGPYGQLWEDVSHVHWTKWLMFFISLALGVHFIYLLGMARAREQK